MILLTAVITMKNESSQLEGTLRSIRNTQDLPVEVLVVDDGSDDGFNYKEVCDRYQATLVRTKGLGSPALARQFGADLVTTKFMLFLDAHMNYPYCNNDPYCNNYSYCNDYCSTNLFGL